MKKAELIEQIRSKFQAGETQEQICSWVLSQKIMWASTQEKAMKVIADAISGEEISDTIYKPSSLQQACEAALTNFVKTQESLQTLSAELRKAGRNHIRIIAAHRDMERIRKNLLLPIVNDAMRNQ